MTNDRLLILLAGLLFDASCLGTFMSNIDRYPNNIFGDNETVKLILKIVKSVFRKDGKAVTPSRYKELFGRHHNVREANYNKHEKMQLGLTIYRRAKKKYNDLSGVDYFDLWSTELKYAIEGYIRKRRLELSRIEHRMAKVSCFSEDKNVKKCESCEVHKQCRQCSIQKQDALEYITTWRETQEEKLRTLTSVTGGIEVVTFGESTIAEMITEAHEDYELRGKRGSLGHPFSLRTLTEATDGWLPARAYALGGRTGTGKTALILQEELHLVRTSDMHVEHVNIEMPKKELKQRLCSGLTNMSFKKISTGKWDDQKELETYTSKLLLNSKGIGDRFHIYDVPKFTIGQMRYFVKRAHRKYGSNFVFVVDNINIMDWAHNLKKEDAVSDIAKEFHSLMKEYAICGWMLFQLNRDADGAQKLSPRHCRDCDKLPDHFDGVFGIVNSANPQVKILDCLKGRNFAVTRLKLRNELDRMRLTELNPTFNEDMDEEEERMFLV